MVSPSPDSTPSTPPTVPPPPAAPPRSMTSVIGLLFTPQEVAMASLFIAVLHVGRVMPLPRLRDSHTDTLLDQRCGRQHTHTHTHMHPLLCLQDARCDL